MYDTGLVIVTVTVANLDLCNPFLSEVNTLILVQVNASHVITEFAIHLVRLINPFNVHPSLLFVHVHNPYNVFFAKSIKLTL